MKVKDSDGINEIYLKVTIQDLEEENKTLKLIQETNENQIKNDIKERDELREEIKELKSDLDKYKKYYDRDKEELMESCYSLAKENEKLKSDLSECECSFGFENDEVGYRKRECKKLEEEKEFFYKSAKQFREQVEKWEKDFVEGRIVEKD